MGDEERQLSQQPPEAPAELAGLGDVLQRYAQPIYQMYLHDKEEDRTAEKARLELDAQTERNWHELASLKLKADLSHRTEDMRLAVFVAVVFVGLGTWLALEGQPTIGYALISFVAGVGGGYGVGSARRQSPALLQPDSK
jgi:hypothetical protein